MLEEILLVLPRSKLRLPLFRHRVIAKAKLGYDVTMELNKFKNEDEMSVSLIWKQVALSAPSIKEQFAGYQKAVESLTSPETRLLKFELLLEIASWMYNNNFQISDCISLLNWASDLMLGITKREDVVVKENTKQKSSVGSRKNSRRSAEIKIVPNEKDTSSSIEQNKRCESQIKEEEERVWRSIGVFPVYKDLSLNDLVNIRQLEGLIRSHVSLARLIRTSDLHHQENLYFASFCVNRLFKLVHDSTLKVKKQIAKLAASEETKTTKEQTNKKINDNKHKPSNITNSNKPKKKYDHLPTKLSDWCIFDTSDEYKLYINHELNQQGLNKQNIPYPLITIKTLLKLSEMLRTIGYHNLSVTPLSLASLIAECLLQNRNVLQLVRLHQIILCYELHQTQAAQYWESFLEEQPISSVDIAKYQKFATVINDCNNAAESSNEMDLPDIWIKSSRIFIKLGYLQSARLLLKSSSVEKTEKRSSFYLASADLAIHDGKQVQALEYLMEAQNIGGNMNFWQDCIDLLVSAITLGRSLCETDCLKAVEVLENAHQTLTNLQQLKPTKSTEIKRLKLILIIKTFLIKLNISNSSLQTIIRPLQDAESDLTDIISVRELSLIQLNHAKEVVKYLNQLDDSEDLQKGLLSILQLLQRCQLNLHNFINDFIEEDLESDVSLPVCRELCEIEMILVEVLLKCEEIFAAQFRLAESEEVEKGRARKIVERYLEFPSVLDEIGSEEWKKERDVFLLRAFSLLNSVYCRQTIINESQSKWLFLIGKGLRLLSEKFSFDHVKHQWMLHEIFASVDTDPLSSNSDSRKTENDHFDDYDEYEIEHNESRISLTSDERNACKNANSICINSEHANRIISHSSEVLGQAVKLAVKESSIDLIEKISLELVECSGQFDSILTSSCLTLLQSVSSIKHMRSVVNQSLVDVNSSLLSSLTWIESFLEINSISTGLLKSTVARNIEITLKKSSTVWKRLSLTSNPLDSLHDIPSSFTLALIHKKPQIFPNDLSTFYCAVIRSTQISSENKGKQSHKNHIQTLACVRLCQLENTKFNHVNELLENLKSSQMNHLLKSEYQHQQILLKNQILTKLETSSHLNINKNKQKKQLEAFELINKVSINEEMKLKNDFNEIVYELNDYLLQVASFIEENILIPQKPFHKPQASFVNDQILPSINLVVLVNHNLFGLPFETVTKLRNSVHILSISRDFSLQMLLHRLIEDDVNEIESQKKDNGVKVKSKDKPYTYKREVSSDCFAIESRSIKYIIDPNNDTINSSLHKPSDVFKSLLKEDGLRSFTQSWAGHYGTDETPSLKIWENQITNSQAFIYYGMNTFVSQIPAYKLVSLSMKETQLVLLIDKVQTHKSFVNRCRSNVHKSESLTSLEKFYETSVLLSLNGVNAICMNQWYTTLESNAENLRTFLRLSVSQGLTVGRTLHKIFVPIPDKVPNPTIKVSKETKKSAKGSKKDSNKSKPSEKATGSAKSRKTPKKSTKSDEENDIIEIEPIIIPSPTSTSCNLTLVGLPNLVFV